MQIKSKKPAILMLLLPQIILTYFYIQNIYDYFWGHYSYDGLRFPLFVFLIDLISIVLLLVAVLALKVPRIIIKWYMCVVVANNIALGVGVEYVAFIGFLICVCSFVSLIFVLSEAPKR